MKASPGGWQWQWQWRRWAAAAACWWLASGPGRPSTLAWAPGPRGRNQRAAGAASTATSTSTATPTSTVRFATSYGEQYAAFAKMQQQLQNQNQQQNEQQNQQTTPKNEAESPGPNAVAEPGNPEIGNKNNDNNSSSKSDSSKSQLGYEEQYAAFARMQAPLPDPPKPKPPIPGSVHRRPAAGAGAGASASVGATSKATPARNREEEARLEKAFLEFISAGSSYQSRAVPPPEARVENYLHAMYSQNLSTRLGFRDLEPQARRPVDETKTSTSTSASTGTPPLEDRNEIQNRNHKRNRNTPSDTDDTDGESPKTNGGVGPMPQAGPDAAPSGREMSAFDSRMGVDYLSAPGKAEGPSLLPSPTSYLEILGTDFSLGERSTPRAATFAAAASAAAAATGAMPAGAREGSAPVVLPPGGAGSEEAILRPALLPTAGEEPAARSVRADADAAAAAASAAAKGPEETEDSFRNPDPITKVGDTTTTITPDPSDEPTEMDRSYTIEVRIETTFPSDVSVDRAVEGWLEFCWARGGGIVVPAQADATPPRNETDKEREPGAQRPEEEIPTVRELIVPLGMKQELVPTTKDSPATASNRSSAETKTKTIRREVVSYRTTQRGFFCRDMVPNSHEGRVEFIGAPYTSTRMIWVETFRIQKDGGVGSEDEETETPEGQQTPAETDENGFGFVFTTKTIIDEYSKQLLESNPSLQSMLAKENLWGSWSQFQLKTATHNLIAYLDKSMPTIEHVEKMPPGVGPAEAMEAWYDYYWRRGGGAIAVVPAPGTESGGSGGSGGSSSTSSDLRWVLPSALEEELLSLEFDHPASESGGIEIDGEPEAETEISKAVYRVNNPNLLTFPVHYHRATVTFVRETKTTPTQLVWKVQVQPYRKFMAGSVEFWTKKGIVLASKNLKRYLEDRQRKQRKQEIKEQLKRLEEETRALEESREEEEDWIVDDLLASHEDLRAFLGGPRGGGRGEAERTLDPPSLRDPEPAGPPGGGGNGRSRERLPPVQDAEASLLRQGSDDDYDDDDDEPEISPKRDAAPPFLRERIPPVKDAEQAGPQRGNGNATSSERTTAPPLCRDGVPPVKDTGKTPLEQPSRRDGIPTAKDLEATRLQQVNEDGITPGEATPPPFFRDGTPPVQAPEVQTQASKSKRHGNDRENYQETNVRPAAEDGSEQEPRFRADAPPSLFHDVTRSVSNKGEIDIEHHRRTSRKGNRSPVENQQTERSPYQVARKTTPIYHSVTRDIRREGTRKIDNEKEDEIRTKQSNNGSRKSPIHNDETKRNRPRFEEQTKTKQSPYVRVRPTAPIYHTVTRDVRGKKQPVILPMHESGGETGSMFRPRPKRGNATIAIEVPPTGKP